MSKIFRTTDKISYKVGELEIKVSPFSVEDKIVLTEYMTKGQNNDLRSIMEGSIYALRCSIKEISGLEDAEGNPYVLQFDGNRLTPECAEDLLNIEQSNQLIALCSSFVAGIPNRLPEGVTMSIPKKKTKDSNK